MNDLFSKVHDKLPIFNIDLGQSQIIYTPGYFLTINRTSLIDIRNLLNSPENIKNRNLQLAVTSLISMSKHSVINWESIKDEQFAPECLTIHVGNECNLNCEYCYSKQNSNDNLKGFPSIETIQLALEYILKNNTRKSDKITIVYHGSGEPSFHWEKLVDSYNKISKFAEKNNLQLFSYIATNGCLTKKQTVWLAKNMNLIGISCDGPPEIQVRQRGAKNSSYLAIDEVCKLILSKGGQFDIRVTITPKTIEKQLEVVKYLIHDCKAKRIRIEPAYLVKNAFQVEDSEIFYNNFKTAQNYTNSKGALVEYSGVRIEEQHGTYCDVLRNTIRLTPEGLFRNCFCDFGSNEAFTIGSININKLKLKIRNDINELKRKASWIPEECNNCINIFHCSRGCPDFCIFESKNNKKNILNPFKCKLHQLITVNKIKNLASNTFAENG